MMLGIHRPFPFFEKFGCVRRGRGISENRSSPKDERERTSSHFPDNIGGYFHRTQFVPNITYYTASINDEGKKLTTLKNEDNVWRFKNRSPKAQDCRYAASGGDICKLHRKAQSSTDAFRWIFRQLPGAKDLCYRPIASANWYHTTFSLYFGKFLFDRSNDNGHSSFSDDAQTCERLPIFQKDRRLFTPYILYQFTAVIYVMPLHYCHS